MKMLTEHMGTAAVATRSLCIAALCSTHMWQTIAFASSTAEVCVTFLSLLQAQFCCRRTPESASEFLIKGGFIEVYH